MTTSAVFRNVYCHDCADVTGYDDEGLCSKCQGDNTLSYTDAEARAWAGLAPTDDNSSSRKESK